MNMSHIESRPSKCSKSEYDFFVDCEEIQGPKLTKFIEALKGQALSITLHSDDEGGKILLHRLSSNNRLDLRIYKEVLNAIKVQILIAILKANYNFQGLFHIPSTSRYWKFPPPLPGEKN